MSDGSLRPRYKFSTDLPAAEIRERLRTAVKDPDKNPLGLQQRSVSNHIIVVLPRRHKHFWSPTLDVNFEDLPNNRTLVRVLIGPEPSIWTMFMFLYTVGGLAVVAGMVLGYSQYILGHDLYWLLLIPAGLLWIGFFYGAGLLGKNRAQKQMRILKEFMEEAIGQPVFHEEETGNTSVA